MVPTGSAGYGPLHAFLAPKSREAAASAVKTIRAALYRYDGKQAVILAVRHGREAGLCRLAWAKIGMSEDARWAI